MAFMARRAFAALMVAALLVGCSTINPATGRKQADLFSLDEERRLGARAFFALTEYYGRYDDPGLSSRVSALGLELAAASERPDLTWTFTILDHPTPNAFAAPGGFIFVTRGLLTLVHTEDQLAAVLAHEIGHVTAKHFVDSRAARRDALEAATVAAEVARAQGANDDELRRQVVTTGLAALSRSSQTHELEADGLAVRYLSRAGYDPNGLVQYLSLVRDLEAIESRTAGRDPSLAPLPELYRSHPLDGPRIAAAERTAAAAVVAQPGAVSKADDARLLQLLDGARFGHRPEMGYVRGRTFLHPQMEIAFDAPTGFRIYNRPEAVYAQGEGRQRFALDGVRAGDATALDVLTESVVATGWPFSLRGPRNDETPKLSVLKRFRLAGADGARGAARRETPLGVQIALVAAVAHKNGIVYRMSLVADEAEQDAAADAFDGFLRRFRFLSEREIRRIKPRQLRVRPIEPRDTVRGLAREMSLDGSKEAWFRLLNGLGEDDGLPESGLVKLVVDAAPKASSP